MHAGYPLLEDLLALLFTHPQVYVEPSMAINVETRPAFYRFLKGIAARFLRLPEAEIARHHGR